MREMECEDRIDAALEGRLDDIKRLMDAADEGRDDADLGSLSDYGLAFDYVGAGTFDGQTEAYFRYQISWGGPSDEFRFFVNPDLTCHRIEYWLLDWFDGASRRLAASEQDVLLSLWQRLRDGMAPHAALEAASSKDD